MKKFNFALVLILFVSFSLQAQIFTPNLKLQLPPHGSQNWDQAVNTNFSTLDGAIGSLQNTFQGTWSAVTTYSKGNTVLYAGGYYVSIVNSNLNNTPSTSTLSWTLILASSSGIGTMVRTVGTGGVTANMLVTFDGLTGNVVLGGGLGAVAPVVGIAQSTVTAGGSVIVLVNGLGSCVADGTISIGDILIVSQGASGTGKCLDTLSPSTGGITITQQIIGVALGSGTNGTTVPIFFSGNINYGNTLVGTMNWSQTPDNIALQWLSSSVATGGSNFNSPLVNVCGSYKPVGPATTDCWTVKDVVGSGTSPTSTLTLSQSGSPGAAIFQVPLLNSVQGYKYNGAAASGNYLRGNGTNFVANTIQPSDLTESVNVQTGLSYTVLNGDSGSLITFNNGGGVTVSLPQAGASSQFSSGWYADFACIPGCVAVIITPTTSTINGASSFTIVNNQSVRIVSDGTNYKIFAGMKPKTFSSISHQYLISFDGTGSFSAAQPVVADLSDSSTLLKGSTAYLTSNYTNATTTFSNVTGLSFAVAASTNYKVRCDLDYQTSATTADIQIQWTGPASPTKITYDLVTEVTGSTLSASVATAFSTALSETGTPTITTNFPLTLTLTLINGANAGTIQLQAAATGVGTVTIIPGSCNLVQ